MEALTSSSQQVPGERLFACHMTAQGILYALRR